MIDDEQVTRDFHLSEFLRSSTAVRLGIDNTPNAPILATLRNVLIPGMQAVRDLLGVPVSIDSGYRCPALNAAVHGAHDSQHMDGHAADFVAPAFGPPSKIARFLVEHLADLRVDMLILEGAWTHISFSPRPRYRVMTAHFSDAGVSYTDGIA